MEEPSIYAALALDPRNPQARFLLARAQNAQDVIASAQQEATRNYGPDTHVVAVFSRADLATLLGQMDAAAEPSQARASQAKPG